MTSLLTAFQSGNRKERLEALRDYLANALDECQSDRDKSSLSQRLLDVDKELASLQAPKADESPAEKIRQASEARRAAQESTEK